MRVTIHQPQFLPWLGYLDKIDRSDLFVVLDNVQFKKSDWQNRNRIRTSDGWQWLTIPVRHRFGQLITEVHINPEVDWRSKHLTALGIHYGAAPYASRYLESLRALYQQVCERLVDLNMAVLRWLLQAFAIKTPLYLASDMKVRDDATDRLIDICREVGASEYLAGPGAQEYMDVERFRMSGIQLQLQHFRHPVYRQCYQPFVPGMAAIDLLFNLGPSGMSALRDARDGKGEVSPTVAPT
jgi:WbqC-like protein family